MFKRVGTIAVVGAALFVVTGCGSGKKGEFQEKSTNPESKPLSDEGKMANLIRHLETPLEEADLKKRLNSIKALAAYGPQASAALEPLQKIVDNNEETEEMRAAAKETIAKIQGGGGAGGGGEKKPAE